MENNDNFSKYKKKHEAKEKKRISGLVKKEAKEKIKREILAKKEQYTIDMLEHLVYEMAMFRFSIVKYIESKAANKDFYKFVFYENMLLHGRNLVEFFTKEYTELFYNDNDTLLAKAHYGYIIKDEDISIIRSQISTIHKKLAHMSMGRVKDIELDIVKLNQTIDSLLKNVSRFLLEIEKSHIYGHAVSEYVKNYTLNVNGFDVNIFNYPITVVYE